MKKILSSMLAIVMLLSMTQTLVLAETVEETDIYDVVSAGIGSSEEYILEQLASAHNNSDGVTYGYEWYIIAMLRAGKTIDTEILDEYYASVAEKVKTWTSDVKPTDAERTALALMAMGKDITDIDGVNVAELIYNNSRLSDGSNEFAYALIALDAADVEIPEGSVWNRESIISGILSFQTEDGAFGLSDNITPEIDMTAICLQALAPYQNDENVKEATEKAIVFLKEIMTENFTFAENVNSTAQVLLTLASLKTDVTNSENGFGDSEKNIITAIESFRNPDGNGYTYDGAVSPMATFQVMQAYDAYIKSLEDILYWDFTAKGDNDNNEDDREDTDKPTEPETNPAEPVNVYVTIASEGNIVIDKNGDYVALAPVTVNDIDENGSLTVDEALYAAHETYYDGGAESGYSTFTGTYGLSLETLWGKGTPGESAVAGYWLNNASCWSLNDAVSEGDYLTAFNYYDSSYWSDSYSYFDKNEAEAKSGASVTLTLNAMGYDENWNSVSNPYQGAKVVFLDSSVSYDNELITDENGQVKISLNSIEPGSYLVKAYSENGAIVPAVCKITVTKNVTRPSSSGGGGSGRVEVKTDKEENKEEPEENPEEIIKDKTEETDAKMFKEDTFSDVTKDDWYYDSVKYVYENNLMQGTENGFEPEIKMSRAMLVTVLYRMANPEESESSHSFTDVKAGQWYSDAVAWAASNGIINGISETEFMPDSEVTREQMAVIIYRFAKMQGYDTDGKSDMTVFSDSDEISDWAIDAVKWANKENIINGTSNSTLSPKNASTRAQVATILMRFCSKK